MQSSLGFHEASTKTQDIVLVVRLAQEVHYCDITSDTMCVVTEPRESGSGQQRSRVWGTHVVLRKFLLSPDGNLHVVLCVTSILLCSL